MEPTESRCPTHLIPDSPVDKDLLGPHFDVARAIADVVRHEDGGRSIGLSGKWGSGKSTVISLLRKELGESSGHKVWVFDAWAHEGDPLRRTFLESLIGSLREWGWIDDMLWKIRTEQLARRRKTSEQKTSPRLSNTGWVIGACTLLIPIGMALFVKSLSGGLTLSRNAGPANRMALLALALILSPGIVLLTKYSIAMVPYWFATIMGKLAKKPELGDELAIFIQRSVTRTRTETIETPEPTSIEFESTFAELMEEALNNKEHKIVLVVDNLDRVDAAEALKIWSTLQTFLQLCSGPKEWLKRLWVIMTFDHGSIVKLWEKNGQIEERPSSANFPAHSHTGGDRYGDGGLAASFLDKSFQVRFEVPAPLMSNWRGYLFETLKQALPKHDEEEFHTIYRLMAVRRKDVTNPPTPRDIKILANQVGAMHRQRGHAVSIIHMAYYVLLRRDNMRVAEGLIQGTIPSMSEVGLVGDGVGDSLAALEFGVDKVSARELLLEKPILDALGTADAKRLKELQEVSEGFMEVLEHAVSRAGADWPHAEGGRIFNAMVALNYSGLLDETEALRANKILDVLRAAGREMRNPAPLGEKAEQGLFLLAARTNDPSLARHLFDVYANFIKNYGATIGDAQGVSVDAEKVDKHGRIDPSFGLSNIGRVAVRAVKLARQLHEAGFTEACENGVQIPGDTDTYVKAISVLREELSDAHKEFWKIIRPAADSEKVVQYFQDAATKGSYREDHLIAIRVLKNHMAPGLWISVAESVRDRLQASQNAQHAEVESLLETLLELRDTSKGNECLEALVKEGHIAHHIANVANANDAPTLAQCVYIYMDVAPSMATQKAVGNSGQGYKILNRCQSNPEDELTEELAKLLVQRNRKELILDVNDAAPGARSLVGKTLAAIFEQDNDHAFFSPDFVIGKWSLISKFFNAGNFIKSVSDDGQLSLQAAGRGFDEDLVGLYLAIVESGPDDVVFRKWCVKELRNVGADAWRQEIETPGILLALADACARKGVGPALTKPFREALLAIAAELGSNDIETPPAIENMPTYIDLLDTSERLVFGDKLYELLQGNPGQIGKPFFSIFGKEISPARLLRDPLLYTKVLEPMVENRNASGLEWVRDQIAAELKIFTDMQIEYREVFVRLLKKELLEAPEDEAHIILFDIARILNVHPDEPVSAGESSSEN
ncbi:hypothetical protein HZA56_15780 [Candidatus Poribacteria bacterium]|nr:hypothetical protein [Candidatus Poribacteria bacterium]